MAEKEAEKKPRGRKYEKRSAIEVYFREDLAAKLRRIAYERDVSTSMLIRDAVARMLSEIPD